MLLERVHQVIGQMLLRKRWWIFATYAKAWWSPGTIFLTWRLPHSSSMTTAIAAVNDCHCHWPLPRSTTTTTKSQRLSFVVIDGGDDNHRQLQRQWMAVVVMTSLPPSSTTTTGWWPTARRCRYHRSRRQCCRHHALALASAITIAAAFANVITPLTLLSMVGCCAICRPSPAASSAIQICQPPPPCGALSTLFPLDRCPLLLTIASRCLSLFYRASNAFAAPIEEGWMLHSPPAQQHTDHITKLKNVSSFHFLDLL